MEISVQEVLIDTYSLPVMTIRLKDRNIVSIPTQIWCPVGCVFCVSSFSRFVRSLRKEELSALIRSGIWTESRPTLVSFTGEGEPLLNIENINRVMEEYSERADTSAFRISLSGIRAENLSLVVPPRIPLHLQFSFHSPFDKIRKSLIKNTNPLDFIIRNIRENEEKFQEIAINYVLIQWVNDSDEDMEELLRIVPEHWIIKLNPLLSDVFVPSERIGFFEKSLQEKGRIVKRFSRIGSSIKNDFYPYLTYDKK